MPAPNAERDARITAAARLGQTHEAIAAEHGISRAPPIKTTSIGRTQWDPRTCTCGVKGDTKGEHTEDCAVAPVLDMNAVTNAIKAQLAVETQFRQMFGTDLQTRPGPLLDEKHLIMMAEIRAAQQLHAQRAPALRGKVWSWKTTSNRSPRCRRRPHRR